MLRVHTVEFKSSWKSPSNIAFVKYWGKRSEQIPCNPSISMTLDKCCTTTKLVAYPRRNQNMLHSFTLEGQSKPEFSSRVEKFLFRLSEDYPVLKNYYFEIDSSNSFPHSSGIASSASAFSALSLCVVDFLNHLNLLKGEFFEVASYISRLGSGSACRSIYGSYSLWGESMTMGSNQLAMPLEVADFWKELRDTIILVDESEKSVSSSAGHALMQNHPFASVRFKQAKANTEKLIHLLRSDDMTNNQVYEFGSLIEEEAMSLHAMMMTSSPSYILLRAKTIEIIDKLKKWRKQEKLAVFFTLDAGPNIHLLYFSKDKNKVDEFVSSLELKTIEDKLGDGPRRL